MSYSLSADVAAAVSKARKEWDDDQNAVRSLVDEWLAVIESQLADVSKFQALSAEVREDGFTHLVLLATDGSALAPDVIRQLWRKQGSCLDFITLDNADPSRALEVRSMIDPARTLFCVLNRRDDDRDAELMASWFYEETVKLVGEDAFLHFIAVTSSPESVERLTRRIRYRHVFLSQPFETFSDFGLVPLAAAGFDVEKLLKNATIDYQHDLGVSVGVTLSTLATSFGRDKVTLLCSEWLEPLAAFVARLLGETTELIPIFREPIVDTQSYAGDRVFVLLNDSPELDVVDLERAGHPVVRFLFDDPNDLGHALLQWQVAAAVASTRLQSPVDLDSHSTQPLLSVGGLELFADGANAAAVLRPGETIGGVLRRHLDRLNPGDYFGLLPYLSKSADLDERLQTMRRGVLDAKGAATLVGFGPGFLEEAGRVCLHGPNSGLFLLITAHNNEDIPVPDEAYTFGQLVAQRARADLDAMNRRQRRIIHVHLESDVAKGLNLLQDLVCAAVEH